ncbi:PREDICTED: peroxiredoxin-6-like [Nicrophorus vespilloides]|uniref:Peroxiredoxin-6-like n=1 Tax=Nicrophorus vespilloides TaxID=110193 RepID=A0ABM1M5L9_NICVS|nr:PREDICTED: peroxiredoxin-6-like [Nicrophorus vespilloides]
MALSNVTPVLFHLICLLAHAISAEDCPKMLLLGTEFPNFTANSTEGVINLHEYLGDSWGILFAHPADFTPVCTTELARVVKLMPEFEKRNVKVIGMSPDKVENHQSWAKDIKMYAGVSEDSSFPYPIIADEDRSISIKLNMIDMMEKNKEGVPLTARGVFIICPKKLFRLSILYPATTGRNFNEILRVVDSLQMTDKHPVATPVDWKAGESVMIQPSLPQEKANELFAGTHTVTLPSGKPYMRMAPQPAIPN